MENVYGIAPYGYALEKACNVVYTIVVIRYVIDYCADHVNYFGGESINESNLGKNREEPWRS
jgi:hypothetical protein